MIKNIIHTLGTRFIVSLLNVVLLLITTKLMGAENKGLISILVLNLSLASIVSGLFGGPSLVYLIPRFPHKQLLLINYAWSAITAIAITGFTMINVLPSVTDNWSFFLLAAMECLVATHMMILLGREQVKLHNVVLALKTGLVVLLLGYFYFKEPSIGFETFEQSYFFALIISLLLSSYFVFFRSIKKEVPISSIVQTLRAGLKFGGLVQMGNIAQLLNYRLSFYFLEILIHPPVEAFLRIGIYSATLQVAEALWQFARSISTVQYATVSNLSDRKKGLSISLDLGKLNYAVTALGIVILLLPSSDLYGTVLGSEFGEIKSHLFLLAPGILALSLSNAFSHFFAGVGLHKHNTVSSILGLALTIAIGYPAILKWGTLGAAGTASLVYISQTLYQFIKLQQSDAVRWQDLMLTAGDFQRFLSLRKGMRKESE